MKVRISIKHYVTGEVLFEFEKENNTFRDTVLEAIRVSANLSYANLSSADLRCADLRCADLRCADLSSANLSYANLSSANLRSANLRYANLSSADLRYADLSSADLSYANLSSANLSSANLRSANLRSANLRYADLRGIPFDKLPTSYINLASRDMLFIFQSLKGELPFLREKLIKGEVNGRVYEGDCACLVGTLANADGGLEKVCETIPYYDKGTHNPAEAWFLNISKGDTPEDNIFSAHALKLLDSVLEADKKKK